jgi:hypothetical protein
MSRTVEQWLDQALRLSGCKRQNAIFEIAFAFATSGGEFTVSFNGEETDELDYNVSAVDFLAALESLSAVGIGNVNVQGVKRGPYFVEFKGELGGMAVPDLVIDGSDLDPPQDVPVAHKQMGQSDDYESDARLTWDDYESISDGHLRSLYVADRLIGLRIGKLSDRIDTLSGQVDVVNLRGNQLFTNALKMQQSIQAEIAKAEIAIGSGARHRTYGGVMSRTTPNGLPLFGMQQNRTSRRWG